jgi:Zn-dependent protease with chaperone function
MDAAIGLLSKVDNIAVLVLSLGCLGLGYLHVVWRREERADRQAMMAAFNNLTTALNEIKVAIAAQTGRQL